MTGGDGYGFPRGRSCSLSAAQTWAIAVAAALCGLATPVRAQVNVFVDADNVTAVMPDSGIALHTSVYANIFGDAALPGEIAAAGVQMLRYPGGNYASIYHWTNHTATGGYAASASHFGNFVSRLLDGSGATGMVTINYGSSHLATMPGQPKEAAAWVAYANGDPSDTRVIGVDDEGNDWRTVGYWANLRGLTPAQNPDNQYDFLAINHDLPLGITYWEIGNEINGNGYYSDIDSGWNWQFDLHAPNPYGAGRGNHPDLSPTAYGQNFVDFANEMKAVDPTIKVGAVLVGPGGVGDLPSNPSRDWDRNVLLEAGDALDFATYHFYPGGGTSSVLGATDDLPGIFDTIRSRIDTYVGAGASDDVEIHMTEFNYFGTEMLETNNGVYAANTYATALADGIKSVHWLELSDTSFVGDTQGGLIRGGAFYGIQTFSHIAEPGAAFVQTASTSGNVEVRSTVLPDGRVGMLIANLNTSGSTTIDVSISDVDLGESGTQWLYGSSQTTPLMTSIETGLGNNFSISVPFRSIMALLIDAAPPQLFGDYNGNNVVDAADYTYWRDRLNQNVTLPNADPNDTDGVVTMAEYDFWKAHFGEFLPGPGGGAGAAAAVPEPAGWLLLAAATLASLVSRRFPSHH